jgi:hypothetical protein
LFILLFKFFQFWTLRWFQFVPGAIVYTPMNVGLMNFGFFVRFLSLFFFVCVALGFEFRASHLLGKCSQHLSQFTSPLSTSLLVDTIRCSRLILYISFLSPRTSHFSKDYWIFSLEDGPRNEDLNNRFTKAYFLE